MKRNRKVVGLIFVSLFFSSLTLASCNTETSSSIAPHECVFYDVKAVEPTCTTEGNIAYKQCPYCRRIQIDGVDKKEEEVILPIDPDKHPADALESVDEMPATCVEAGTKAYQHCTACDAYIVDGKRYTAEESADVINEPINPSAHKLVSHAEVPASCIPGTKAYDECEFCKKLFIDGKEVTADDLVIPANGEHSYDMYGVCKNGCGTFKYDNTVFDISNKVELTPALDDGWYLTGDDDSDQMFAAIHEKKMTFQTQVNEKTTGTAKYDGDSLSITYTDSKKTNMCSFTRFIPGTGSEAYTGRFYLSFDLTISQDTNIERVGAIPADMVDNTSTAISGNYSKLIGHSNNETAENNPDRTLKANTTYRFIYDMYIDNSDGPDNGEVGVQIWTCGGAGTYTINNMHYIPVADSAAEDNRSTLLYFGESDLKNNEKDIPVKSISLNKTELTLAVGESETLVATVEPANATDRKVAWRTTDDGDPSIVEVDADGKVTALNPGQTTIVASVEGWGIHQAECKVIVVDKKVAATGVSLDKDTLELTTGEGFTKLTATVAPEDASDKSVSWSSSDEKVATVDEEGNVTPVSAGEATITVTTADGSFTDTCKVTVNVGPYYTFKDENFFDPSKWYDSTESQKQRDDSIKDDNGGLKFDDSTPSRMDLFHIAKNSSGSWEHPADKLEKLTGDAKDMIGKTYTFNFTMSSTGEFDMLVFGNSSYVSPSTTAGFGFLYHFSDNNISLLCHHNNHEGIIKFECSTKAFKYNQNNEVSLITTRVDDDTLTIQLSVNGEVIKLAGETVSESKFSYSVDSEGVLSFDKYLKDNGFGQRFGIYPSADSVVTISRLSIDPEPTQK